MTRIAFIHPDKKLQALYRDAFSPHFQIDSAFDGLEGLRLIRQKKPHLIISEYRLPIISGESLLRFVRNHHELFSVPFIFLSSYHPAAETLGLSASEWVIASQITTEGLLDKCHQHLRLNAINYV